MLKSQLAQSQCSSCGKKVTNLSTRAISVNCCGIELQVAPYDGARVVHVPSGDTQMRKCKHRGARIASGSCGCGGFYECLLLGGLCGNMQPVDEWVTITFVDGAKKEFKDVEYRRCAECEEFQK